jgi:hypothetical protein
MLGSQSHDTTKFCFKADQLSARGRERSPLNLRVANVRYYLDRVVRDKMNINATCQMTESEYERERAELDTIYGRSGTEAAAKRDQALAKLFYRSGWTQEQLQRIIALSEARTPGEKCMGRALEIVATLFAVIAVAWIVIAQRIDIWRGLREGREAKRRPDRSKHRPF